MIFFNKDESCLIKKTKGYFNYTSDQAKKINYKGNITLSKSLYLIEVRKDDDLKDDKKKNYLDIVADKSVRGVRGFMVKSIDTEEEIQKH